ncbi:MAG: hypothetical protein ACOX7W_02735 [Christensenellales bacterium]|jgi:hypothetical protein
MNCGCPECGTLTVHTERGRGGMCVCPACGWSCSDCLGLRNDPARMIDRDTARAMKRSACEGQHETGTSG